MKDKRFSRRQFLRIIGISAAAAATWQLGIRSQSVGLSEVNVSRMLMGTVLNLTVVGEDDAAARTAVSATLEHMSSLENILSRHQSNSQLSLLNQHGKLDRPSSHLVTVLQKAQEISTRSEGAFDVTVKPLVDLYQSYQTRNELPPEAYVADVLSLINYQNLEISTARVALAQMGMGITLDGIAKGYIVDEGTKTMREQGIENVLVEAGGDLWASGSKDPGSAWQIGIRSPRRSGKQLLATFGVENRAVATSGDYLQYYSADHRYHHILDPRSGYSAPELASATVTAPSAMLADGLATAVMAMPVQKAVALLNQTPACEGYLIAKTDDVYQTGGFPI